MNYIGKFTDINGLQYEARITINDGQSTTTEIMLAEDPVIISMESDDNIFKPCKYRSATIRMVSNIFLSNVIANQIFDIPVEIVELGEDGDDTTLFTGYVTPESFNQAFSNTYNEYELNCVDKLAALKNIKYDKINGGGFVSFIDILKHGLIDIAGCYSINVDNEICTISTDDYEFETNIWENLYISETNFFDEDNEPWLWSDVIEEIMKYMCCSAMTVDYDQVVIMYYPNLLLNEKYSYDRKTYYKYTTSSYRDSGFIYQINHSTDKCNNGNITINPAYNSIKIVSDNYPLNFDDSDLLGDEYDNVTDVADTTWQDGRILPFIGYLYKITQAIKPENAQKEYWYLTSFYKPKNIELYGYNDGGTSIDTSLYPTNFTKYNRYVGCCLVGNNIRNARKDITEVQKDFYGWTLINTTNNNIYIWKDGYANDDENYAPDSELVRMVRPNDYLTELDYSFSPTLSNNLVFSLVKYKTQDEDYRYPDRDYKFLHYTSRSPIVVNKNFYLTFKITGDLYGIQQGKYATLQAVDERDTITFYYTNNQTTLTAAFPLDDRKIPLPSNPSLTAMLKVGDYYWNGTNWQTSETTFELPIEEDESNYGHFTNKKNSKFTQNIEGGLYVVPCNITSGMVNGYIEFSLLYPQKFVQYYYTVPGSGKVIDVSKMLFTDFEMEVVNSSSTTNLNGSNTDSTEYTVIIDEDNISQYADIEQKICTWDNLAPNYSAVYIGLNEDELLYVDKALFQQGNEVRFEERALQNYYTQLSKPQFNYDVELSSFIPPTMLIKYQNLYAETNVNNFILNGYEYNIKYQKNNINMVHINTFNPIPISKENIQRQYYRTGLIYKANPS